MKPQLYLIGGTDDRMLATLRKTYDLHIQDQIPDRAAFLAQNGAQISAVATNGHDGVPADVLSGLPNVGLISCFGVGYDGVDIASAVKRGIVVTHTPNVLNADVANTAIMLLLAASRNLIAQDAHVRSGRWSSAGGTPLETSVEGQQIGILGLGRIGLTIARKLQAFDCRVVYHSRNERNDVEYQYYGCLTDMARDCWAVVSVVPGGASTDQMINTSVLNAIGPNGIFVNVGRGSSVDEPALISALQDGRLGHAALDVFADEPNVPDALRALNNVTLTPHIASATVETRRAMGELVVENLVQFATDGRVMTPVPECRAFAQIK